ncbi:MAG: hypothetical protein NC930_08710 [Candidatus Omnitrophica bacterium]|nr:hypothetical protein [Candidatus Omnitrophota bacterium]
MSDIFYRILTSIFDEHSWFRLEKTVILARGFPLYYGTDSGPALVTLYGPVSVLAYLPAALVPSPFLMVMVAQAIAFAFVYLPAFWIHIGGKPLKDRDSLFGLMVFFCFSSMTFRLTSLRAGIFTVHADAPTLGLCASACACLYFRTAQHTNWSLFWSSLFAVLAVWSKQVAVPLLPALALYLYLTEGTAALKRFLFFVFVTGTVVSAIFLWAFDARNMFLHMFVIPSQHALRPGVLKALSRISREWLIMAAWGIFSIGPSIFHGGPRTALSEWVRKHRWFLFMLVGFFMLPVSVIASLKVGGSNNTHSYTNYFILLATTTAFLIPDLRPIRILHGKYIRPHHVVIFMTVVMLAVNMSFLFYRVKNTSRLKNFALEAYEFVKAHPGEAYFPRLTLIHLLAENKLYHSIDGLMDRDWAGMRVTGKHLRDYIPPRAQAIIFYGEAHRWLLDLPEFEQKSERSAVIPGAVVYRRIDSSNSGTVR